MGSRAKTPTSAVADAHHPESRYGSIGWLALTAFDYGYDTAIKTLRDYLHESALEIAALVHRGQGIRTARAEAEASHIAYDSYDPPPLWGAQYSILLAHFESAPPDLGYLSHPGEEVLVPIQKPIQYQFVWTPGGTTAQSGESLSKHAPKRFTQSVRPGQAIRLFSAQPHHTYAERDAGSAWMFFKHAADSQAALHRLPPIFRKTPSEPRSHRSRVTPKRLRYDLKDANSDWNLADPATYALKAWGIAESFRIYRERAKLNLSELARYAGIAESQLSRLETATQNVSLDVIVKVARLLQLPLDLWLEQSRQKWLLDNIDLAGKKSWRALVKPNVPHRLHVTRLVVQPGMANRRTNVPLDNGQCASWIVYTGSLDVRIQLKGAVRVERLQSGSVLHFRTESPQITEVHTKTAILQISSGEQCTCGQTSA